jgi:hypothetical protein
MMNHAAFAPIRNTALPHAFRCIRLERARDHDHPEGDRRTAYVLIAPLDGDSRIDADLWRAHKDACRIVRTRPHAADSLGHLVHGPGGSWRLHYDVSGNASDEIGHHFSDERFEAGEYVSIHEADGIDVYRVASVTPL